MIHCAGSRVHTDGLHAVQLHTDSATGSVPKHGEMQGPHTQRAHATEGPCNRGSMQQRVHATFHAMPVPTLALPARSHRLRSHRPCSPPALACIPTYSVRPTSTHNPTPTRSVPRGAWQWRIHATFQARPVPTLAPPARSHRLRSHRPCSSPALACMPTSSVRPTSTHTPTPLGCH